MVDPDVQGQGLSWVLYGLTTLVLFIRDGLRPRWISNVTQVPAVCGMVVRDLFRRVSFAAIRQLAPALRICSSPAASCAGTARVRRRRGGRFRRGALRHHGCLYRRLRCAEKILRRRAKASRRAIQRLLRPRTGLRQAATISCRSAASISPPPGAICSAKCRPARCRRCSPPPPCWRCNGWCCRSCTGWTTAAPSASCGRATEAADDVRRDRRFHRQSLRRHRACGRHGRAASPRPRRPADQTACCSCSAWSPSLFFMRGVAWWQRRACGSTGSR